MTLDSKDYFDQFYIMSHAPSYTKSLLSFFYEIVQPRLSNNLLTILDLGAGNYSLFHDVKNLNANVYAIDFSKNAIKNALKSEIKYIEGNIADSTTVSESNYDLIFDSHCFNCLVDEVERKDAFKNVYMALKPDGIFASEMMAQPIGKNVSMPYKIIKSAFLLEQEILSYGFKIIYFMILRDSAFTNEIDGVEIKCDVLRILVQK